ncbi:MAG: NUDIX hydrolase [Saprospiraceae bacterium]|nr:NUDIX hydrolase [Saprospiraceae bacterium]
MSEIRLASTIMLAREKEGVLEVLLVRRNKALNFAGGAWVFPGGKIDEEELIISPNELEAAKQAAVRETKEEANLDINPEQLIFFRHWTTPANSPRRFATYFFFGAIEERDAEVVIDEEEIVEHEWLSPQAALQQLAQQKKVMLPPTILCLRVISHCHSISEAQQLLGKQEPIFVLPVVHYADGQVICLYRGDAGYESGDSSREGARHRLIIDMAQTTYHFEFRNCEGYLPVDGGAHRF